MVKVLVDVFGGDHSPEEILKGCKLALDANSDLCLILAGDEDVIGPKITEYGIDSNRIEILDAKEVISNDESPTEAIRRKKDSTIVKGFEALRQREDIAGFVSAGSTGAVLTGAFLKLGRTPGVSRPALCPMLPTVTGGIVGIVDCGANVDTKPENLVHFALMGNAYMKSVFGVENPRVALLSVGVEDHKGNELTKTTFHMLKDMPQINFVGNMEARDLLSGEYDLVVCDGFAGNVLLKSTEGAVMSFMKMMKENIMSHTSSKIGAMFMKKTFKELKNTLDFNKKGGSVLLGCKKIVVKCHGASKAFSIKCGIEQVVEAERNNVCGIIADAVAEANDAE
ncbi:MAG: phosphate acyltransferase PlsX [Clostridiales bacterium]|nr:phosphate acyltransferase PlsX [Clostridiales bacterium]